MFIFFYMYYRIILFDNVIEPTNPYVVNGQRIEIYLAKNSIFNSHHVYSLQLSL